ncbi:hypothetical protein ACOMHN_061808 [Nucella lapillus]
MRYAILPTQLQPQKIPGNNLYNCSVPHFSLFKPVISCNFIVECQAKEDEAGCDYSGKDCGPGAVEDGTKCITLERPDADTTWYTSNSICKSKQQQLVTIVNNETANKIKQMDSAYDIFDFYVGLQLTTPSSTPPLSSLYRTVWQWVDGRSAFSVEVTRSQDYKLNISFPLCSLNYVDKLSSSHCFKLLKVDILCEYDKPVVNKTLLEEPAAGNNNVTFANLTMVPCRSAHVTRDFLLCDSQSQCDADSQESCLAESNRVFMFQCKNEELIPYTLVCDHVVHCTDGSDESFCQFRLCPSGVFQCNNPMLPTGFDLTQCHAEQDLLASCEDLLRSDIYRIFLWIFASLSVIGNFGSFIGRMYLNKEDKKLGSFSILVTNLTVADFFMGVYLIIIGAADQVYLDNYLWNSEQWKNSATCSLAGFLSLMSSEVSAFIICLITLDRFLVLCFPFSTFHFKQKSALVACAIAWTLGIILAGIPLMPFASHWEYYSQTGICIPLPFGSNDRFEGQAYSFAIMIVINFVVFLLIAVGQIVIFWSIRKNTMATAKDATSRQATIARRLTTIVVSDFLCWFPIGLLGLMAFTGTQIPGEIKVAVAIFVLPFNSALNPFLYTFNILMEKRQKAMENILLQRLEKTYQTNVKSSVAKPSNSRQQPEHSEQFSTSIKNTEHGARL